jgi:hypothetical protein
MLLCSLNTRISALRLGLTALLLSAVTTNAKDAAALESALELACTAAKVILACSPILAIVAVLALAREDDETEAAKRTIKCVKS